MVLRQLSICFGEYFTCIEKLLFGFACDDILNHFSDTYYESCSAAPDSNFSLRLHYQCLYIGVSILPP